MIELAHGDWTLALRPELGSSVTRLVWRGRDILRPAPVDATHPLETASFPLVPYANRIDRGAFRFADREISLPATSGFEPHALHGLGWLQPWSVLSTDLDFVDLATDAKAGADWPWAWTAAHRLQLDDDGLEATLSITNKDETPMPAGLGLHPYFVATDQTIMTLSADEVWLTDPSEIPRKHSTPSAVIDWAAGIPLAGAPFVDNAYGGWSGPARLEHRDHFVEMSASANAPWVQVYAPGSGGFVCIEPVTHRPDAHNAPRGETSGLVSLKPGETLSISMRITAAASATTQGEDR
ncbi:aldose 1-epimerase [Brevundimonas sp.]|uniref:aldose 1-epimerase n=1 Tax=Brevundimonas sp. TaxID=1871086 RepID=UPI00286BEA06|nr:aldose 1-epimerase [Brevundimonas sp.]